MSVFIILGLASIPLAIKGVLDHRDKKRLDAIAAANPEGAQPCPQHLKCDVCGGSNRFGIDPGEYRDVENVLKSYHQSRRALLEHLHGFAAQPDGGVVLERLLAGREFRAGKRTFKLQLVWTKNAPPKTESVDPDAELRQALDDGKGKP